MISSCRTQLALTLSYFTDAKNCYKWTMSTDKRTEWNLPLDDDQNQTQNATDSTGLSLSMACNDASNEMSVKDRSVLSDSSGSHFFW